MSFKQLLCRLTVTSATLLTASFCPPAAIAAGELLSEKNLELLMSAIASVAAGNTANAIDALVEGKDSDRVSLQNEDLVRAVGKAIV